MDLRRHSSHLILVFTLFAVFAICALMLCTISVGAYRSVSTTMQTDYSQRTGALYLTQKLRQADVAGAVRVASMAVSGADAASADAASADALVLTTNIAGQDYADWIFVQSGMLREELLPSGQTPDPNLAQAIMPMQSLQLKLADGRLDIRLLHADGSQESVSLTLRSQNGENGAVS
jgi:hypothetical protein